MAYNQPGTNTQAGNKPDGIVQTLEMPLKESKEGVFSAFLRLQLAGAGIIGSIENTDTDERINDLVDWMISTIPNTKFQESLRRKRDGRIEEEIKAAGNNQEKGRITKKINREIMGEISAYMDKYAGGERENRISFIIPNKKMREWIKENNPSHFDEGTEQSEVE